MTTKCNDVVCYDLINPAIGKFRWSVWLRKHLDQLISWGERRHLNRINRQAFQSLLKLDDNILKDIGVTRDDITYANSLPLTENAAEKLDAVRRKGTRK